MESVYGPPMADPLHSVGQLTIGSKESVEIVLGDLQQVCIQHSADRGGAQASAEQGHFAKSMSFAEDGDRAAGNVGARLTVGQNLHLSMRDDIEGIARVAGLEQNFARLQLALVDTGQNLLDLFGRQMAHEVARSQ